ncbi:MAG: GntR family transcriptional regulator [Clostridiales Family XIII bacterium]|nr:GntR family transcriptional regulator [Clostridiales Family XIII bacterium]
MDLKGRKSIYEQVVDNLRDLILSGALREDEKLPSVRELSKSLTVNPNTVQKAYRELERQQYVYTVAGLGTFVEKAADRPQDAELRRAGVELLRRGVRELRLCGMENTEIRGVFRALLLENASKGKS